MKAYNKKQQEYLESGMILIQDAQGLCHYGTIDESAYLGYPNTIKKLGKTNVSGWNENFCGEVDEYEVEGACYTFFIPSCLTIEDYRTFYNQKYGE